MVKNIILIVGTRPNFMKAAPLYNELIKSDNYNTTIVHTGQHYDYNMSDIFFEQLGLTDAKLVFLNVKKGSQNTQIANIMLKLEIEFNNLKPDMVLVFGDVTSTLAAALTCNKMKIKVGHVEAGNRSFDRSMPEEINRILTDSLVDYHFVAEPYALDNLRNEGMVRNEILEEEHVFYVGNTMIDSLLRLKGKAESLETYKQYNLIPGKYILTTLHRPHNVDNDKNLKIIFDALVEVSKEIKIIFPVHPRRREKISQLIKDVYNSPDNIILCDPLGYLEFMNLNINSGLVLTDSGGLQEETTVLKKQCITLRPNTERAITCTHGTNYLLKELDTRLIVNQINTVFNGLTKTTDYKIPMWDGHTAERIVKIIDRVL